MQKEQTFQYPLPLNKKQKPIKKSIYEIGFISSYGGACSFFIEKKEPKNSRRKIAKRKQAPAPSFFADSNPARFS